MKITLDAFKGALPKLAPRLLSREQAQEAFNTKLWSGELRPQFEALKVQSLDTPELGVQYSSLYGYERGLDTQWLTWVQDVDVAKGPVSNDIHNRIVITGLTEPRVTDSTLIQTTDTTVDTTNSYRLAVDQPDAPVLGDITGTATGDPESRTYVITYVREWEDGKTDEGQASAPAKKSTGEMYIDIYPGQSVAITGIKRPVNTDCGIKWIRVYRSAVASDGTTSYQFVYQFSEDPADVAAYPKVSWTGTTFTFNDDVPTIDLQEVLKSAEWTAPIDSLKGIVSLNNGILAAFSGNDIYFSEPYQTHAWPVSYKVTLDYKIVGIGYFGNNVVACTEKFPVILYVNDPSSVIPQAIGELAPCMSKNSIVNANGAVFYATPNGLIAIDTSTPKLWTQEIFDRDEWLAHNPSSFIATMYRGAYFCFFSDSDFGSGGFILDFAEPANGVTYLDDFATAVFSKERLDQLHFVSEIPGLGFGVFLWEGEKFRRKDYSWKSKIFTSQEGIANFSAARVNFAETADIAPGTVTGEEDLLGGFDELEVNETLLDGDQYDWLDYYGLARKYCTFEWIVDGDVVFTKAVENGKPFRLPAGMRAREFEVRVTGNRFVASVDVATSIRELE